MLTEGESVAELGEGDKDEGAFFGVRMGEGQAGRVHNGVTVEYEVEVEQAVTICAVGVAVEVMGICGCRETGGNLFFNGLQVVKKFQGREG